MPAQIGRFDRSPYQPGRTVYEPLRQTRYIILATSANQASVIAKTEKLQGQEWMPLAEVAILPTHRITFGLDDESIVEPGQWIQLFPGVIAAKGKAPYSPPQIIEEGELGESWTPPPPINHH